ncbi:MAG: TIGR03086 family protein [Acidimicrobiia bacterium]|nr:TIGR03086 family protein [Acidimicrobiia bacterium]
MDAVETLDRSRAEFRRVLGSVRREQWELPTPCEEWDVRELVNHVIGGNRRYEMLLHDASAADLLPTRSQDHVGGDAVASFDTTAAEAIAAFEEPGALERTVHHPAGDRSGLDLLWLRVAEWAVHAWDLARAIGADDRLNPELVDALLARLTDHGTGLEAGGYYAAAATPGANASPQARLLLLAGRQP